MLRQTINFASPEFFANPYPTYKHLRETAPVYFDEGLQTWVVTAYEDVSAGLKDHAQLSSAIYQVDLEQTPDAMKPLVKLWNNVMSFTDPPRHTRLRTLIHKAFTPQIVEKVRGFAQETMNQLIDEIQGQSMIDIKNHIGLRLPIIVIAELLGAGLEDRQKVKEWADAFSAVSDPAPTPEVLMAGVKATVECEAYFAQQIDERQKNPRNDLLTLLIQAEDDGARLTREETIYFAMLLMVAGYETLSSLLGNGILALLKNPDQWELLKQHPEYVRTAFEEFARYDNATQLLMRVATQDFEMRGMPIAKGDRVTFFIGSANHDPKVFQNPEKLDITRSPNPHLSFSQGIHYCVGAPLARLEAEIVFQTLIRCLPEMRLAEEPERYPTMMIHSLKNLYIHP